MEEVDRTGFTEGEAQVDQTVDYENDIDINTEKIITIDWNTFFLTSPLNINLGEFFNGINKRSSAQALTIWLQLCSNKVTTLLQLVAKILETLFIIWAPLLFVCFLSSSLSLSKLLVVQYHAQNLNGQEGARGCGTDFLPAVTLRNLFLIECLNNIIIL